MKRVLIVEDDQLMREGLTRQSAEIFGLNAEILGAGSIAEAGYRIAVKGVPDLILLDMKLPDADGAEGLKRLKPLAPSARVVVISGQLEPVNIEALSGAGADAFLRKTRTSFETLREACGPALSTPIEEPGVAGDVGKNGLAEEGSAYRPAHYTILSQSENLVVGALQAGLTPKQIAEASGMPINTVKSARKRARMKLGPNFPDSRESGPLAV